MSDLPVSSSARSCRRRIIAKNISKGAAKHSALESVEVFIRDLEENDRIHLIRLAHFSLTTDMASSVNQTKYLACAKT